MYYINDQNNKTKDTDKNRPARKEEKAFLSEWGAVYPMSAIR